MVSRLRSINKKKVICLSYVKRYKKQKNYRFLCKNYNLRYVLTRVFLLSKFCLKRCFWREKHDSQCKKSFSYYYDMHKNIAH